MEKSDFDIRDFLHHIDGDFNILDEEIDIDVQKEFFEMSNNIDADLLSLTIEDFLEHLKNHKEQTVHEIKQNLFILSTFENVNAYRALETFKGQCSDELRPWCSLALQQCHMMLKHAIDEQQQVIISTGLGGKDGKLRYQFIFPFILDDGVDVKGFQIDVLKDELKDQLNKCESELEAYEASGSFAIATVLMPLEVDMKELVIQILEECNQFGTYLSDGVIVTNVKRFSNSEVEKLISDKSSEKQE